MCYNYFYWSQTTFQTKTKMKNVSNARMDWKMRKSLIWIFFLNSTMTSKKLKQTKTIWLLYHRQSRAKNKEFLHSATNKQIKRATFCNIQLRTIQFALLLNFEQWERDSRVLSDKTALKANNHWGCCFGKENTILFITTGNHFNIFCANPPSVNTLPSKNGNNDLIVLHLMLSSSYRSRGALPLPTRTRHHSRVLMTERGGSTSDA